MSNTKNGESTDLATVEISVPVEFRSDQEVLAWIRNNRTPLDMIKVRDGRAGQQWHYIPHQYVEEMLNRLTNFDWDFRILREWIHDADDQVTVLGELTVRVGAFQIVKTQYGSNDIARYSSGDKAGKPLSIGDALKSAASDALKKCAMQMGLGNDMSLDIQASTLKRLHIVGLENCDGDAREWKRKRVLAIRTLTNGDRESSKELSEIEARILIATIQKNTTAPIVRDFAAKLK